MTRLILAAILSISPALALADDMDPLIGDWASPDGTLRHRIERTFDDSLLETRMWFQVESEWKLVSQGIGYRRPGEKAWRFVSRVTDMQGIELFESTIEKTADNNYRVANISYMGDGSTMETDEEWTFVDDNRYTYTIFRTENGQRAPWYTGEWIRVEE
jgi:hypothetical protein